MLLIRWETVLQFKERRRQNGQRASVTATFESSLPNLESVDAGVPVTEHAVTSASGYAVPGYPPHVQGYQQLNDGTPSGSGSPATRQGHFLSRSQSSATLDSSDSSVLDAFAMQQQQQQHGQPQQYHHQHQHASGRMGHPTNRSESDMMSIQGSGTGGAGDTNMSDLTSSFNGGNRHRSRSSPQRRPAMLMDMTPTSSLADTAGGSMMDPSSGRAAKIPGNTGLHRHNSVHAAGGSPSPRRPGGLHRTQSSTSSVSISQRRANRPQSLAAAAFGLTSTLPQHSQPQSQPPPQLHHHQQQQLQQQQQQPPQQQYLPMNQTHDNSPLPSPSTSGGGASSASMQPFVPSHSHSHSHINLNSSMTSSTSSLPSSQTSSSVGQPMTPSQPNGLFTNHVLENRMPPFADQQQQHQIQTQSRHQQSQSQHHPNNPYYATVPPQMEGSYPSHHHHPHQQHPQYAYAYGLAGSGYNSGPNSAGGGGGGGDQKHATAVGWRQDE